MQQSPRRQVGLLVAVALLVALAGCNVGSNVGTPTTNTTATGTPSPTGSATDGPSPVTGDRTLNATSHNQGTTTANFLLAPNETQANTVLDSLGENDTPIRYVTVDWQSASTYAAAGGTYYELSRSDSRSNVSSSDYYRTVRARANPQQYFNYRTQAYYESMVVRLYRFHGGAKEPQPWVVDWEQTTTDGQTYRVAPQLSPPVKRFRTMDAARNYTRTDSTSQLGGFGAQPGERVPALEQYRYVDSSEPSAYTSDAYNRFQLVEASLFGSLPARSAAETACETNATTMSVGNQTFCLSDAVSTVMTHTHPARTKTFERVPGATIEGTAPANSTIEATVAMRNDVTGESFTYAQQVAVGADGRFEMTVPYATTGYDAEGTDDGYADVRVRAEGPYQFNVPINSQAAVSLNGTAQVTEHQVLGESQAATSVNLTVPQNIDDTTTAADG